MDQPAQTTAVPPDQVEVALLDIAGMVVSVNDAWVRFGLANGATSDTVGLGASYLDVCDADGEDEDAQQAGAAVRMALAGGAPAPLHVRFPCDAPDESRWFEMLVSSRFDDEGHCVGATVAITRALPPRAPSDVHPRGFGHPDLEERPGRLAPPADGRIERLLEAHAAVLGARQVPQVTRQLVRAASELVRADHGTLGVLGPDGTFTRFVDDVDEPRTRGVNGATRGGEVLAVPVPVRAGTFGLLYLTRRGAVGFTDEDERLAATLAACGGVAIDNARMHEDADRRRAWQAVSAVAVQQLFNPDDDLPVETMLRLALRGADADFVTLAGLTAEEMVVVEASAGPLDEAWLRSRRPLPQSLVASVLSSGTPVLVDLARRAVDANRRGIRSLMAAPLVQRGGRVVALVAGRRTGREAFDHVDLEHLTAFAGYAGSALDVHRSRKDREKMLLLEEHERIAAELHGQVVQELFIVGMGLQGLLPEIAARDVQRRVLEYVDALDATIHRIRSTVFEQQERRQARDGS